MAAKAADLYKHTQTLERNLSKRLDEFGGDGEGICEDGLKMGELIPLRLMSVQLNGQ
jgi:hypothetical protein